LLVQIAPFILLLLLLVVFESSFSPSMVATFGLLVSNLSNAIFLLCLLVSEGECAESLVDRGGDTEAAEIAEVEGMVGRDLIRRGEEEFVEGDWTKRAGVGLETGGSWGDEGDALG
jgi:hypothetical protein